MAQNISLMGASYPNVPSVKLPKTGGGQASFVDVTGASLSSSDGSKILTGQTAYGNDGGLINGTMPDYTTFPLYSMQVARRVVTPATNENRLTIPEIPECDGPVKLVVVQARTPAAFNSIYADASHTIDQIVLYVVFDRQANIFSPTNVSSPHFIMMAGPRYYSSGTTRRAYVNMGVSQTDAYSNLVNESGIKTGGAYISTPKAVFRKEITYCILVGW